MKWGQIVTVWGNDVRLTVWFVGAPLLFRFIQEVVWGLGMGCANYLPNTEESPEDSGSDKYEGTAG